MGCKTAEGGSTLEADGIMGLTRPEPGKAQPYYEALYDQYQVKKKMVSLCYGMEGGQIVYGGYDTSKHLNSPDQIVWVNNIDRYFWTTSYEKMLVG